MMYMKKRKNNIRVDEILKIIKGTVTQVLQVEINLNLALRGKNRKGDVFRIFDFGREHR